jgi:hypothetical protein
MHNRMSLENIADRNKEQFGIEQKPLSYSYDAVWNEASMHDGIRERVEALRREIGEIQRLNLAYLQTPKPGFVAVHDHARREQRVKEIMHELKSMTAWKRP